MANDDRELGSWKCGKGRTFNTLPQTICFFIKVKFPNKVIIQGRGKNYSPTSLSETFFNVNL